LLTLPHRRIVRSGVCAFGDDMGACMSTALGRPNGKVLLLLGLDGSGSTSVLYQLVLGKFLSHLPTLGANREEVTLDGVRITCFDVGGLANMRQLWDRYLPEADGIAFVVDSSDEGR
jgi:GTPase SAR1 family protein